MSKTKMSEYCVADAISEGVSSLEQLRDEVTEWYENLPENFQNGDKGDQLQEVISALDNVDGLNISDAIESCEDEDDAASKGCVGGLRFQFAASTKKRQSRNDRCSEACALLRCAIDAMQTALAETENEEVDRYVETRDDIESSITDLESLLDEAEGVSFPGMYG